MDQSFNLNCKFDQAPQTAYPTQQHENHFIPNYILFRMHQCCAIGTKGKHARSCFRLFLSITERSSDHEIYH